MSTVNNILEYDFLKKDKRLKRVVKRRSKINSLTERPRVLKFPTSFKSHIKNKDIAHRVSRRKLKIGSIGFKAISACCFNISQIETIRKLLSKYFKKKKIKIIFKLVFNNPVTKKGLGVRMGRGKGKLNCFTCNIIPGEVFLELEGTFTAKDFWLNFLIFKNILRKLPFNVVISPRS